jgi:hypothetical protein
MADAQQLTNIFADRKVSKKCDYFGFLSETLMYVIVSLILMIIVVPYVHQAVSVRKSTVLGPVSGIPESRRTSNLQFFLVIFSYTCHV